MTLYFAWIDETEVFSVAHAREDADVFSLEISQSEGDFAYAAIAVRNPRAGLLSAGRKRWCYVSHAPDGDPSALSCLFKGRIVGIPDDLAADVASFSFIARPSGFDAAKAAAAASLRVAPYWDPLWLSADARADPDSVLEARAALWHVDRVTHAVTISSVASGEDGTLSFGEDDAFADSVALAFGQAPLRTVHVEATASWDQQARGEVDFSRAICKAAKAAGSGTDWFIRTYTGDGLVNDWPQEGKSIGSGWEVARASAVRQDGAAVTQAWQTTILSGGSVVAFPVWTLKPVLVASYDVSRRRSETLSFDLVADAQAVLTEPDDADALTLALSTGDAQNPVDPATSDEPGGAVPIGDVRRRSFFDTDRGRAAVAYLIALARAHIVARARCVTLSFEVALEDGLDVSCRRNVLLSDGRIPGGSAAGKITAYAIRVDGDSGQASVSVSAGCTAGLGNTVTASAGDPDYADDDYVEDDWQARTGAVVMPVAGEVTYDDFTVTPDDDGVDFLSFGADEAIVSLDYIDGASVQANVIGEYSGDTVENAIAALNAVYTEIKLDPKPLATGPFDLAIPITVSRLMLPKTIDLEAAST